MTRRERLESKLEKRTEWAEKAEARSDAAYEKSRAIAAMIPLGQPILIAHHSERHARRDQDRIHSGMSKSVAESQLAKHHIEKAEGLERMLDNTIFSDDDNAVEALEQRIAEREAIAAGYVQTNKDWRKVKGDAAAFAALRGISIKDAEPVPLFRISNLRAVIRNDKKRLEQVKDQQKQKEAAIKAGGVAIRGKDYIAVTFAEKPSQDILNSLKAADFHWSGGSWCGYRANLPEGIEPI